MGVKQLTASAESCPCFGSLPLVLEGVCFQPAIDKSFEAVFMRLKESAPFGSSAEAFCVLKRKE
jgi:hypothetical protein